MIPYFTKSLIVQKKTSNAQKDCAQSLNMFLNVMIYVCLIYSLAKLVKTYNMFLISLGFQREEYMYDMRRKFYQGKYLKTIENENKTKSLI